MIFNAPKRARYGRDHFMHQYDGLLWMLGLILRGDVPSSTDPGIP